MRKLSEIKGIEALDVLAEIVEPVQEIVCDEEVRQMIAVKANRIKLVKPIIKNHKQAIINILAILEGEEPAVYAEKVNVLTLPLKLIELLNDQELMTVFRSAEMSSTAPASTSALESDRA